MDEIGEMSIWLKWFWPFQTDEIDKISVCLQYIWNENGKNGNKLYYFKPFEIEMDRMEIDCTVSNYFGMEMSNIVHHFGPILHCFKPFGIEMSNTVHHFGNWPLKPFWSFKMVKMAWNVASKRGQKDPHPWKVPPLQRLYILLFNCLF